MLKLKKINIKTFIISFCFIGILTYVSFIAAWAKEDGTCMTVFCNFFAMVFEVLRFPTHHYFWNSIIEKPNLFIPGLLLNSLLFSFLLERIFSLVFSRKRLMNAKENEINS